MSIRYLIPIFGDQLSRNSRLFDFAERDRDVFVMAEVRSEILRHQNHRQRVILFLSAMRHFRADLEERGYRVLYQQFDDAAVHEDFESFFETAISLHRPESILMLEPGRFDLEQQMKSLAGNASIGIRVLDDTHFFCSRDEFRGWAEGRSGLVMEHFYRHMRRKTAYLMDGDDPAGGAWNFDAENRKSFGASGPPERTSPRHTPDDVVSSVSSALEKNFPDLPGNCASFLWPVTPDAARAALDDFIENHLASFGPMQDAVWTDRPFLHHSLLSTSLNLKLLDPRDVVEAAVAAYEAGHAPIQSVEGFVRQILGWREYMRGLYWMSAPAMAAANFFEARKDLPAFFWSARTDMACVRDVVTGLIETGYAHHIQRLMVAGLFCLLYGVDPRQVHDWFMALYVDSVEWVTLPNTIGMSQFADGGEVATKPYIASGKYIDRMSNYCGGCRFDPAEASGSNACPFTTLYWDFIRTHESYLQGNGRTILQVKNYRRKSPGQRGAITRRANEVRELIQDQAL